MPDKCPLLGLSWIADPVYGITLPQMTDCCLPATPGATGGLTKASIFAFVFLHSFLPSAFWGNYLGQGEYY